MILLREGMGMVEGSRHAAWHKERSFAVQLLHEQDPPTQLAGGFAEFLDAFDFAYEWLSQDNPANPATSNLGIYKRGDGSEEKVWAYPPAALGDNPGLVSLFGFDPVNWKSPVAEFPPAKRTIPVSPHSRPPSVEPPADAEFDTTLAAFLARPERQPTHETVPPKYEEGAREEPPVEDPQLEEPQQHRESARKWAVGTARSLWDDVVSRSLLILCAASIWLSLTLSDSSFLLLLLVGLPGLWWRRGKRAASATADTDYGDW
jgi:hypothetical protein